MSPCKRCQRSPDFLFIFFFSSLLLNDANSGFFKWAQKVRAWSFGIWLIPKGGNGHWTLIVVVFLTKQIIYLDSLYGTISNNDLQFLCMFIETVFSRADIDINWSEWTVFFLFDVPSQISKEKGVGVN